MSASKRGKALTAAIGLLLVVVGCSKDDDDPKVGNGVNDVAKACDIRVTWNRSAPDCSLCEAGAISPRCDCSELKDFSAACSSQQDARKTACAPAVDDCVYACDRNDCACIIACYSTSADCKRAADARDGCVAEACSSYCK